MSHTSYTNITTPAEVISLEQLEYICQPQRRERTLQLVYYLSCWAKSYKRLIPKDRREIYKLRDCILSYAVSLEFLTPEIYINRSDLFSRDLLLCSAPATAARGILRKLNRWEEGDDDMYCQHFLRRWNLHHDELHFENLSSLISNKLRLLVNYAIIRRQPLRMIDLAALAIAPVDLLHLNGKNAYLNSSCNSWSKLEEQYLELLDPEGHSRVAFRYTSQNSLYRFSIPYRWAEKVLGAKLINQLPISYEKVRDFGEVAGKELAYWIGLDYPLSGILSELGVTIPHLTRTYLEDTQFYLEKSSLRDILWM